VHNLGLIDYEASLIALLQWLRSNRFLGSLALGGDAMLRLCHELPRYSLDLDFCFIKEEDNEEYYHGLNNAFSQEYLVIDSQNNQSSMLFEIQRETRNPKLKIEIHKIIAPPGTTEEKIAFSPYFSSQVLVRGFILPHMVRRKALALLEYGEIVDAFDLEFLVRKGVSLDLAKEQKKRILLILNGFRKREIDLKLGSILQPDLRVYYSQQGFAYLKEKLSFEPWENESQRSSSLKNEGVPVKYPELISAKNLTG
jgi:hypothetical protein